MTVNRAISFSLDPVTLFFCHEGINCTRSLHTNIALSRHLIGEYIIIADIVYLYNNEIDDIIVRYRYIPYKIALCYCILLENVSLL